MSWHQPDCQWFEDKKPWKHPKSTNVGACVYAFSSKPKMHPVQFNWHSQCSGSLPKDTWHRSDLTDAFFAKQKMHWNMWHQILGVERVLYMLYAFSGQAKNASEWKMHLKPIQVKTSLVMEFHHCVCFPSENASCQGWSVLSSNFSNAFSEGKLTHWRNSGFYERERTTPIARHTIANARPQAAKEITKVNNKLPEKSGQFIHPHSRFVWNVWHASFLKHLPNPNSLAIFRVQRDLQCKNSRS